MLFDRRETKVYRLKQRSGDRWLVWNIPINRYNHSVIIIIINNTCLPYIRKITKSIIRWNNVLSINWNITLRHICKMQLTSHSPKISQHSFSPNLSLFILYSIIGQTSKRNTCYFHIRIYQLIDYHHRSCIMHSLIGIMLIYRKVLTSVE